MCNKLTVDNIKHTKKIPTPAATITLNYYSRLKRRKAKEELKRGKKVSFITRNICLFYFLNVIYVSNKQQKNVKRMRPGLLFANRLQAFEYEITVESYSKHSNREHNVCVN